MANQLVSIVAPVYNEETVIAELVQRSCDTMKPLTGYDYEIVLVDDGSQDNSLAVMKELTAQYEKLRVVELRGNFGQTPALQAGLDAAQGEIVITLDADLQHFPEEIPNFLAKLDEGYDMVCGWRHKRAEGAIRRWPSAIANKLLKRIARVDIHDFGTTFRAYDARIIPDLRLYGEFHRFIPVLGKMAGARIAEIPIKNIERPAGVNNYGIGRTFGVFLDLFILYFFVRYMDRPMRAFGKLAAFCFAIGSANITYMVIAAAVRDFPMFKEHPGWFIFSAMLLMAAGQLILAGILAEILVRVHYEHGDRRVYKVRNTWQANDQSS